jgi:hypothetical protein
MSGYMYIQKFWRIQYSTHMYSRYSHMHIDVESTFMEDMNYGAQTGAHQQHRRQNRLLHYWKSSLLIPFCEHPFVYCFLREVTFW